MAKLLMITGLGSAIDLASGKKGAFYYTLEEFSKYWERIDIISPRIPNLLISRGSTSGGLEAELLFRNVFVHISPWPLVFHPLWFLKKGIQICKEQKFNLMTVHEYPPFYNGIGARILWYFFKIPYVLEIHHVPGYPKVASLKENIYLNLMRWFIKFDASKAMAVRVVNKKQTPGFLVKAGVSEKKIIYIPSMYIDLEVFKPIDVPKEYDLIFVGRLVENKGINLFIEVVKRLNIRALIVGDGSLKGLIKTEIEKKKLKIDVCGWVKDSHEIAELMNKSKILVMPSYNEGGPRVVLEAMACGVPVLATPVGIVLDLVKDGESGGIIDWQSDNIALKTRELLSNLDKYNKYSQAGIKIAKQFEKKEAIKNYADKLEEIIG